MGEFFNNKFINQRIVMSSAKPKNKNHFTIDPSFEQEDLSRDILVDKVGKVMKQKFSFLKQVYLSKAYETGYNSSLAFRVIVLYLHCQFKTNEEEIQDFDLVSQVQRFLSSELAKGGLQNVRKCMDLLVVKELPTRVADKIMSLWKIRVLQGLKKYYVVEHVKKQKKKASLALRELCKEQLKKQNIKHQSSAYTQILDILINEEKAILNSKKSHGKIYEAIENASNIIGILEKAQQMIIPKYQEQLMLAYWQISQLHFQLHYVTYARKYAEAAINIAQRINDKKIAHAARAMLESLAKQ